MSGVKRERWTRAQRSVLASCYWRTCPGCDEAVPIIKAVGSPAAGFDKLHKPTCAAVHPRNTAQKGTGR